MIMNERELHLYLYKQLNKYGGKTTTERTNINSSHDNVFRQATDELKMSDEENLDDSKTRKTNKD